MSTPEAARRLARRCPSSRDKPLVAIPNGFDADDFAGRAARRDDDAFRIVHTGYLHTELGLAAQRAPAAPALLGGAMRRVDILDRSHVYLLEARRARARRDRPELAEDRGAPRRRPVADATARSPSGRRRADPRLPLARASRSR